MTNYQTICVNKRAGHDYELLEKVEAGLVLTGTEVKSLRLGKANITEAFVIISGQEAWVQQMQIAQYSFGNRENHEEFRKRKLLLSKKQIQTIEQRLKQGHLTVIPLRLYFKDAYAKIEIAIGRGKREYDKRADLLKKDVARKIQRADYDH
jgi:SsrA-binding protein